MSEFIPHELKGPLEEFQKRIKDAVERVFARQAPDAEDSDAPTWPASWLCHEYPALDMSEDERTVYVTAEMPGLGPGDFDVRVAGNRLIISGERKPERDAAERRFHVRERRSGRFSRSVALPEEIDAEHASASCRGGVLTVTLPKAESAQARHIHVHMHEGGEDG
jgi:HSP20 family molecular chaperone IbpA